MLTQGILHQAFDCSLAIVLPPHAARQVSDAVKKIQSELGDIEVLVYNAGASNFTWPPPPVVDVDINDFRQALEAGVVGGFIWSKLVRLDKTTLDQTFTAWLAVLILQWATRACMCLL